MKSLHLLWLTGWSSNVGVAYSIYGWSASRLPDVVLSQEFIIDKMSMRSFAITDLTCGLILLTPCCVTMNKIRTGSQIPFAYVMMSFTLGYALLDIISYFNLTYVNNDIEARCWQNYFYFLLSLQSWLFASRYLESALSCHQVESNSKFPYVKWGVTSLYICALTFYLIKEI